MRCVGDEGVEAVERHGLGACRSRRAQQRTQNGEQEHARGHEQSPVHGMSSQPKLKRAADSIAPTR
jgi:hypothetical protein